ncbi:MAG: guanylate kinase [Oscillospiraceae bacterium]|jgi:guanylate kinase|nr:guanylate kinase [Oscillospiraceae bacterium]
MSDGRIIIISSPSGAGKGTIISRVRTALPDIEYSVSLTTRAPRPGEHDGVHYHFVTQEEFCRRERCGEFLECNPYSKNRYGTLRAPVERAIARGRDIILEIEVKGARDVRRAFPDSIGIFIAPPDFEELRQRLLGRRTDSAEDIADRMAIAEEEMHAANEFDYVVVNDDLDAAASRVLEIISGK